MSLVADNDGDPQTPDTIYLEDPFSPRTTARHAGDFARLIPANRSAQIAFDEVAQMFKSDPDWMTHARQFVHILDAKKELSPSPTSGTSDSETEQHLEAVHLWDGYYRFNLDILPSSLLLGWVAGSGRKDLKDQGVDLLLTVRKRYYRVRGRHVRFKHSSSGAFMLIVDDGKSAIVNGHIRVENGERQLGSLNTSVTFGELMYNVEFTQLNEARYRHQISRLEAHQGGRHTLHASLEITPSVNYVEFHGFLIQNPFDFGADGVILAGTEIRTGQAVAVKRLKRTEDNVARIQTEVEIYRRIGEHPNLCHLVADIYSGGDQTWTGGQSVNDVYLIHTPLGRETFHEFARSKPSLETRLAGLHQILKGLEHLHYHGIMHRDIKPSNLVLASRDPLYAVIIDYGRATFEPTSKDHESGTVAYLAPEIMRLKEANGVGDPYDQSIDVWALGVSGYQLLFDALCDWGTGIDAQKHADIIIDLDSRPEIEVASLLKLMLVWDSFKRTPVRKLVNEALFHL